MVLYQAQLLNTTSLKSNQNQFFEKQQTPDHQLHLLFLGGNHISKKDNPVASVDTIGTGCSLSYSIGKTVCLNYVSGKGIINLGLQRLFLYSEQLEIEIPETILSDGETLCFIAEATVIMTGDGKQFKFQDGSHLDIIACINIVMKHGTTIEHDRTLHASIYDDFYNMDKELGYIKIRMSAHPP